ncbi:carboxylate-amine ligase [Povalibacter uvarum]|uniref:Carboxylate-amine ligase n=1 Tax=Povalibacter uvarum TaxID=732238 RepID=A0A841HSH1_9GAMM|nr:glutamate-cysteine ligase family protein [Povalibacter uvarum]MBB6096257.1 carboxylate-amine ligase [Povalibacter uvarum]
MNQSAGDFDYAFTIREGFFVCEDRSYKLVRELPPRFVEDVRAQLGTRATIEKRGACIEVTSQRFLLAPEPVMDMPFLRDSLASIAESHGLRLLVAGTHPLGTSTESPASERRDSGERLADLRIVEQAQQTCGLRVQVSIPSGIDRVALMNRSIPWLPLFLALSTSSPFWNGSLGGLLSCRQARFDQWPYGGTSDFLARNTTALELNISDACTRVEDSVAIANLFRCHVSALVRNFQAGADHTPRTYAIAGENRSRAKRDGMDAQFISDDPASTVSVRRLLARFLDSLETEIARFGCGPILTTLVDIANAGTSAHEQLRIYERSRSAGHSHHAALESVLQWLTLKVPGRQIGKTSRSAGALFDAMTKAGFVTAEAVGHR